MVSPLDYEGRPALQRALWVMEGPSSDGGPWAFWVQDGIAQRAMGWQMVGRAG